MEPTPHDNDADARPPTVDIVLDCAGESYRREFEIAQGCWSIYLYWREYRIGRLYGVEGAPGIILLNEVRIEDALRLRETTVRRWIREALHRPPPTRNFRGRKLGAHLLPYFIDQVRSRGQRRIQGNLSHSDLERSPFLPAWYEAHGFTVTLSSAGGWAGKIFLEIDAARIV